MASVSSRVRGVSDVDNHTNSAHGLSGRPTNVATQDGAIASRLQSPSDPRDVEAAERGILSKSTRGASVGSFHDSQSVISTSSFKPQSMRDPQQDANGTQQPHIGTFKFEEEDENEQDGARTPRATDESSSNDDLEKQKERGDNKDEKGGKDEKDPNLIDFDGPDDPTNPQNWSNTRKWIITLTFSMMTFAVTYASSTFSSATTVTAMDFHVSPEVTTLATALFVLGFAWGPPIWGPASEYLGRKPPLFIGYFIFAIFAIPVAVAQNIYTIFICRFFGGFFSSAPLTVVGGLMADMWDPITRAYAMAAFSATVFVGPACGPVVGSFIVESYLGWRWVEYISAIMAFFFGAIAFFIIPETFSGKLLSTKAKKLRIKTKNWALHSSLDEQEITGKIIVEKYVLRPFTMLAQEPILLLITLYISLIYGILYLFFEAFPVAFQERRGLSPSIASLPFLALLVGVALGGSIIFIFTRTRYRKKFEAGNVTPEERLVPMFVGGALMPIGLFWFAWTSNPAVNIWAQIVSIVPVGAGIMVIFMQGLNYLIDTYLMYANSAIAANTFARSWVAAGFIMFATGMFHDLGVPWASSLLGFLCIALYPAPVIFYIYGKKIRSYSKFSPTA